MVMILINIWETIKKIKKNKVNFNLHDIHANYLF